MCPMTINRGWDLVRKKAGIHDTRLHDLRHTVCAVAGATLPAFMVQTILGHKQPSTTSRYAKPIDSATEQAVHNLQHQIAPNLGLRATAMEPWEAREPNELRSIPGSHRSPPQGTSGRGLPVRHQPRPRAGRPIGQHSAGQLESSTRALDSDSMALQSWVFGH